MLKKYASAGNQMKELVEIIKKLNQGNLVEKFVKERTPSK